VVVLVVVLAGQVGVGVRQPPWSLKHTDGTDFDYLW